MRRAVHHSAPRPAPPLDHIESGARCGGLFCVRAARVPKGLGALERGGTRESGRATYLGYEKRYWMLLRQHERHAARVLGYEAATWEGGGETEACSRPWDALVADELSAALLLGYSSQSWGEEHEAVEEALGWVIVRVETQARHSGTADGTTSRLARDRRLLPSQAELQSHTLLLHPLL
jgi:hypothetical protein